MPPINETTSSDNVSEFRLAYTARAGSVGLNSEGGGRLQFSHDFSESSYIAGITAEVGYRWSEPFWKPIAGTDYYRKVEDNHRLEARIGGVFGYRVDLPEKGWVDHFTLSSSLTLGIDHFWSGRGQTYKNMTELVQDIDDVPDTTHFSGRLGFDFDFNVNKHFGWGLEVGLVVAPEVHTWDAGIAIDGGLSLTFGF